LIEEGGRVQPWPLVRLVVNVAIETGQDGVYLAGNLLERPLGCWLADLVRVGAPEALKGVGWSWSRGFHGLCGGQSLVDRQTSFKHTADCSDCAH
jgi:hypothetical protein